MTPLFEFPLYSLMWAEARKAVLLRGRKGPNEIQDAKSGLLLPLFTSREDAILYCKRSGSPMTFVEFENPCTLLHYCRNPPKWDKGTEYEFIVDPIAPDIGEFKIMERDKFIQNLEEGCRKFTEKAATPTS